MSRFSWRDEPTRRDILAAFLGVPLALSTGCSRKKPPLPEGEIIGPSFELAHKLRDGFRPKPEAAQWFKKSVVIVGGGIAGLSAAWRLLRAGFDDFVVLELEPRPGGTSRYDTSPITSYPWGAHYLPVPMKENRALVRLLKEMRIVEGEDEEGEPIIGEETLVRDPEARIWHGKNWYVHDEPYLHPGESAEDVRQHRKLVAEINRWVKWRDGKGRRAFGLPIATASEDPEVTALDRQSMADWLNQKGFTSARLRWMIDYACRDDYGASFNDVSAWSGLFYFASRKRDVVSRRKRKHELESQPFMVWPEGNGKLVRHFVKTVQEEDRERLRLGLGVSEVTPVEDAGKPGVDVVAWDQEHKRAVGFRADRVIFCAPQFVAKYLIRALPAERLSIIPEFEYSVWMVANLHLKERPAGPMLAWDNILYESKSLGYVTATHQLGSDHGPTVLTYYYPMTDGTPLEARRQLLSMTQDEAADIALTDLERPHPDIRKLVERIDVMRWGHAMPRPKPGLIWGGARAKAAQAYRNIHFAHSDLSGVGIMEEAFYQGIRAAEEVLKARNARFESFL
jgi:protoporphyrinogen oxidase